MNVILLHGSLGHPFENWFPWLKKKLSDEKLECIVPTFPTPDKQEYAIWERLLDFYFDLGLINHETIIIGHSCGAAFAAKYIITKRIKLKGLISVAGYNNFFANDEFMDKLNCSFYSDVDTLSTLNDLVKHRICFYSAQDPYIPINKLEEFANIIHAEHRLVLNGGHFNQSAGYLSFPELYNTIHAL